MSISSVTHNFGSASRGIEVRLDLVRRSMVLFDRISNTRRMGAAAAFKCKELVIERSNNSATISATIFTCFTSYAV